jgi:hypothetical protein
LGIIQNENAHASYFLCKAILLNGIPNERHGVPDPVTATVYAILYRAFVSYLTARLLAWDRQARA